MKANLIEISEKHVVGKNLLIYTENIFSFDN